jgi:DNA polymerase III subunit delta
MPTQSKPAPLALVCGEDEFSVKARGAEIYKTWTAELGGLDHEIIDGTAGNAGEALKSIARLREALNTLPFFGSGKVVWLKNCTFLGEDRTAASQDVTAALGELVQELKAFKWDNVRLLVTAGKVHKGRTFYKTFNELGNAEIFAGLSLDNKDWVDQAEMRVRQALAGRGKRVAEDALAEIVSRVGPNSRQLDAEAEKLSLYVGERTEVQMQDVSEICIRNKNARAFALGDALGDRDLPRLLKRLDEELWEVKLDPRRSEVGLLYGLISKVRAMILLQEMLREGWVKQTPNYTAFKNQLAAVPADRLPSDQRFNPLQINSYVLFKALPQVRRYSQAELVNAMDLLLKCNQLLVSSSLDNSLVLQQTLVRIVGNRSDVRP